MADVEYMQLRRGQVFYKPPPLYRRKDAVMFAHKQMRFDLVFIQVPFKTTSGIDINLKKLKFRGSIPSDATAIPAMGLTDMSAPVRIDVISGLQHVKSYIIKVTQK